MPPKVCSTFDTGDSLDDLGNFFLSSLGPRATLKMFVSPTGYLTVTSTSQRIMRALEFNDPFAEAVQIQVRAHLDGHTAADGGLLLAVLICKMTALFYKFDPDAKLHISDLYPATIKTVLNEERRPVEFKNAQELVAVVKTILGSKGTFSEPALTSCSVLMTKAFLQTIPTNSDSYKKFHVQIHTEHPDVNQASNRFELVEGLLFRYPENDFALEDCRLPASGAVNVLLLDLQLKDSMEDLSEWDSGSLSFADRATKGVQRCAFHEVIQKIATFCLQNGVKVLLNQKVIATSAYLLLRSRGIWPIERLGRDACNALADISGAIPLTTINVANENAFRSALGHIDNIMDVSRFKNTKRYLHFTRPSSGVYTVRAHALDENQAEELKLLCTRARDALYNLLVDPHVLPSGGCLEACIIRHLLRRHTNANTCQEVSVRTAGIFAQIIEQLHGNLAIMGELRYHKHRGHLWRMEPNLNNELQCMCKSLVYSARTDDYYSEFQELSGILQKQNGTFTATDVKNESNSTYFTQIRPHLSESIAIRERVLLSAFEASQSLSNIGWAVLL